MRSKRARKYLINSAISTNSQPTKDQDFVWRPISTIRAVHIAEEDMIEKAAKAFAEACEMYAGNGRCLECGKCEDCERVKQFKQRLDVL